MPEKDKIRSFEKDCEPLVAFCQDLMKQFIGTPMNIIWYKRVIDSSQDYSTVSFSEINFLLLQLSEVYISLQNNLVFTAEVFKSQKREMQTTQSLDDWVTESDFRFLPAYTYVSLFEENGRDKRVPLLSLVPRKLFPIGYNCTVSEYRGKFRPFKIEGP